MIAALFVPGLSTALWAAGLGAAGTMATAFVVGRLLHRFRDVDVFWPLGFVVVAWIAFGLSGSQPAADSTQRCLLAVGTSIWGLRLAGYLAWRSRGAGEDPRYLALVGRAKGSPVAYGLVAIYGLQAVLLWVVSLTIVVGMFAPDPLLGIQLLGAGIWGVGLAFESVGDAQLHAFLTNPDNAGRVLDTGLWAWTRHPNYFGDACVWWGLFVVAAAGGWGVLVLPAPVLMSVLLVRISGKALTERRMGRTRIGFADYVASTSGFIPRPPRRIVKARRDA